MADRHFDWWRVDVVKVGERDATWAFAKRPVQGRESEYSVADRNFRRPDQWTFVVRVPDRFKGSAYIAVEPLRSPARRQYADVERRSLMFRRATRSGYRHLVYAKLFLSDVEGERTKVGVRRGQRGSLPDFIPAWRLRLKKTVVETAARDGQVQVIILKPDDHPNMVRAFLATKAWIFLSGFALE